MDIAIGGSAASSAVITEDLFLDHELKVIQIKRLPEE